MIHNPIVMTFEQVDFLDKNKHLVQVANLSDSLKVLVYDTELNGMAYILTEECKVQHVSYYAETDSQEVKMDDPDFVSCPMCSGTGIPLGTLGKLEQYSCQNCGINFYKEVEDEAN